MVRPGDLATVSVVLERDRFDIVHEIRAVVREARDLEFALRDDGNPPDAMAEDDSWTVSVNVLLEAYPGEYTLELIAYDSEGQPIPVLDPEGNEMPLSTICAFTVETAEAATTEMP